MRSLTLHVVRVTLMQGVLVGRHLSPAALLMVRDVETPVRGPVCGNTGTAPEMVV